MVFEVTDGLNTLSIGLNSLGSYFKFIRPVSFVWGDNRGSVAEYMCLLPLSENERATLYAKITSNLNEDFTERTDELYQILKPLFQLLANGEYHLSFDNGKLKHEYTIFSGGGTTEIYTPSWYIQYADVVDLSKTDQLITNHSKYIKDNNLEKDQIDVIEYTTTNLYDWRNDLYFATRPESELDLERVRYFEEMIKNGQRPFAILMNAHYFNEDINSRYFILDGHHKLQAYQNLDIQPPIAVISRNFKSSDELEFDVERLTELLYPWQTSHILEHWEEKDRLLPKLLANPNSILHKFIKNGLVVEYHDNGKKKHEAFYINDRVDGLSKGWYPNGQLKYEHFYNCGTRTGIWKDYHLSGLTAFIQQYDEQGDLHGQVVSFFVNGNKRMEQFYEHGKNKDGVSYRVWFENGDKEAELSYLDGRMIERKNWNSLGELVNHEIFNADNKHFEKVKIPESENIQTIASRLKIIRERHYGEQSSDCSEFWFTIRALFFLILVAIFIVWLLT